MDETVFAVGPAQILELSCNRRLSHRSTRLTGLSLMVVILSEPAHRPLVNVNQRAGHGLTPDEPV